MLNALGWISSYGKYVLICFVYLYLNCDSEKRWRLKKKCHLQYEHSKDGSGYDGYALMFPVNCIHFKKYNYRRLINVIL